MITFPRRITSRCTLYIIEDEKDNPKYVPSIVAVKSMTYHDALKYHEFALNYIENQKRCLPELIEKNRKLREKINPSQTFVERKILMNKINENEQEIAMIKSDMLRKQYIDKVSPYIKKFSDINSSLSQEKFGVNNDAYTPDNIISIVVEIIDIIKSFTNIKFDLNIPCRVECIGCKKDLTDLVSDNSIELTCPNCKAENNVSIFSRKFKIADKFLPTANGEYSDRQNFFKFYIRFRGDQNTYIDSSICDILDKYFLKRKKKTSKEIKNIPLNNKGFKDGTSFSMMTKAMKSCKLSDYYDDVYLICKIYWGWKLADLDADEQRIMYIYDTTQHEYNLLENKTRSSSISIPLHFFKIIELLGYPYDVYDFKVPKEEKSKLEQESYWKNICEKCKDPSIYYIPTKW